MQFLETGHLDATRLLAGVQHMLPPGPQLQGIVGLVMALGVTLVRCSPIGLINITLQRMLACKVDGVSCQASRY